MVRQQPRAGQKCPEDNARQDGYQNVYENVSRASRPRVPPRCTSGSRPRKCSATGPSARAGCPRHARARRPRHAESCFHTCSQYCMCGGFHGICPIFRGGNRPIRLVDAAWEFLPLAWRKALVCVVVTVQPYAGARPGLSAISYQLSATAIPIQGQRWGRDPSARTEKLKAE